MTFRFTLTWGRHVGHVALFAPAPGTGPDDDIGSGRKVWASRLSQCLAATPVPLVATLAGPRKTLGEINSLRPGDVVAIPHHAGAPTVALTARGRTVLTGDLGRADGQLGIRIAASGAMSA